MPNYELGTSGPPDSEVIDYPKKPRTQRSYVERRTHRNKHPEERVSIIVKADGGGSFAPHPVGAYPALCIDVMEHLNVETKWGTKNRIQIRFYCGQEVEHNGEMVPAFADAFFNATLGEGSSLRAFTESWRGKPFTKDELDGFDMERLVDAPALIQIVHNVTPNKTYANIDSIMRLPQGSEAPRPPIDYVRVKDQPREDDTTHALHAPPVDDDDLPFRRGGYR